VPYRNSMMTMVLKDSLGGNCRTVMVANINPDQSQLDESISTCRFAMRVALVRNQVGQRAVWHVCICILGYLRVDFCYGYGGVHLMTCVRRVGVRA